MDSEGKYRENWLHWLQIPDICLYIALKPCNQRWLQPFFSLFFFKSVNPNFQPQIAKQPTFLVKTVNFLSVIIV